MKPIYETTIDNLSFYLFKDIDDFNTLKVVNLGKPRPSKTLYKKANYYIYKLKKKITIHKIDYVNFKSNFCAKNEFSKPKKIHGFRSRQKR